MPKQDKPPWLTPKSESFEAFVLFLVALLAVGALIYLAVVGKATPVAVGALVTIFAAVARRWLR